MTVFQYDGTWNGFLTAVFEAYAAGSAAPFFARPGASAPALFGAPVAVETQMEKALRVARGVEREGGLAGVALLHHAFLSEHAGIEAPLWHVLHAAFSEGWARATDERSPHADAVRRAARATRRETHRMHAFVRFEETASGVWVARIAPACHVLTLVGAHFGERYGALRWCIHDTLRHLSLVHEAGRLSLVETRQVPSASAGEAVWQRLWRAYYAAVNIPERQNLRLRQRHVPRRYWPLLPELAGEGRVE